MCAGEVYNPQDNELVKERERAQGLTHMYNQLEDDYARDKLIRNIFHTNE